MLNSIIHLIAGAAIIISMAIGLDDWRAMYGMIPVAGLSAFLFKVNQDGRVTHESGSIDKQQL